MIRGYWYLEATIGFEPMNTGFADPRLKPLGHVAIKKKIHEKWILSGRWDSCPRQPHWQGGALPAELLPQKFVSEQN